MEDLTSVVTWHYVKVNKHFDYINKLVKIRCILIRFDFLFNLSTLLLIVHLICNQKKKKEAP